MKSLLVHTPQLCHNKDTGEFSSNINFCAMGLYSLAKEIEKEGIESEIIHLGIEKYLNPKFLLSEYINEQKIKFVAFSLHWHPQSYDVIEMAKIVKEKCPQTFITLGGFTASYFAQEIMGNYPFIDSIIKGEGEIPIRELAKKIANNDKNLSTVPNLFWRKNREIIHNSNTFVATDEDLNSFIFFDIKKMKNFDSYAKIPFHLEYNKKNQLNNQPMSSQGICLGRGCTGNCTWCGGGHYATQKVTGRNFISYRNPDEIIKEIKMLKSECKIENFRFAFDPHPENRACLMTLLEKIEKEFEGNLTTMFTLNGLPDKNFLEAYSKAFSKNSVISISPEFYDEKLRKKHKTFYYSNSELEEILEYMDKLEIHSELYFSTLPITTDQDNKDSDRYGKLLQRKYKCVEKYYLIPITYEPAAPWTINPEKFGINFVPKKFAEYRMNATNVAQSFENPVFLATKEL